MPRPWLGRITPANGDRLQNVRTVCVDLPQLASIMSCEIRMAVPSSRGQSRPISVWVTCSRPADNAASNPAPLAAAASVRFALPASKNETPWSG